jgi:NAD(P)-dependent dehydrogenase (short-subunit alcohol dehydrogenase family)
VETAARQLADEFGVTAVGIQADVSQAEDIDALIDRIGSLFEGVDILINNAGTGSNETILDAPDEKWQYFWDLHVMGAVRLARGLVPLMRRRGGGVILNNASICAKQPLGYEPIYNTTKAALMMLSKCMANEFIRDNIRVNCLNPGLVLTPDWRKTAAQLTAGTGQTPEQYLEAIARDCAPIGRFASPEELADVIVFLCSPRSSYCVGSTYYVDGGWLKGIA